MGYFEDLMAEQGLSMPMGEDETGAYAPAKVFTAGSNPETPVNEMHPQMGVERYIVMNLATTPETAQRYLESQGWQVVNTGGWNFSVRRPGDKKWYKLDPGGMKDWGRDILDIGGDILTGLGAGLGAGVGLAGGAPSGPGALATAAAGGAAGGGLAELLKQQVGIAFGLEPTLGERLSGAGAEAALGAAAPVIGKGIGKAAKALMPTGTARQMLGLSDEALEELARSQGVPTRAAGALPEDIARSLQGVGAAPAGEAAEAMARFGPTMAAGQQLTPEEVLMRTRFRPGARPAQPPLGPTVPPTAGPVRMPATPPPYTGTPPKPTLTPGRYTPITREQLAAGRGAIERAGMAGAPRYGLEPGIDRTLKDYAKGRIPRFEDIIGRAAKAKVSPKGPLTGEYLSPAQAELIEALSKRVRGEEMVSGVGRAAERLRRGPVRFTPETVGHTRGAREAAGRLAELGGAGGRRLPQQALTEEMREDLIAQLLGKQPITKGLAKSMAWADTPYANIPTGTIPIQGYYNISPGVLQTAMVAGKRGLGQMGRVLFRNISPLKRLARAKDTTSVVRSLANRLIDSFTSGDLSGYKATLYMALLRPAFRSALEDILEKK